MRKQTGYTLIELMIGVLVGLIVVSGVSAAFLAVLRSSSNLVNSTALDTEVGSTLDIMVGEIRRAGYVSGAISSTNPYVLQSIADISTPTVTPADSCLLYSYDVGENGPSLSTASLKGFKLNGTQILMRQSASAVSSTASTSCSDGSWGVLTSDRVSVTDLTFDLSCEAEDGGACTNSGVNIRWVDITLVAESGNDSDVRTTINERVKVQNNVDFD